MEPLKTHNGYPILSFYLNKYMEVLGNTRLNNLSYFGQECKKRARKGKIRSVFCISNFRTDSVARH